jgi:CBS domain-containing protein
MVRKPKTLSLETTVADARRALEQDRVKILLIVDDRLFRATVSGIPDSAGPNELAITYADVAPEVIAEDIPVATALERLGHRPNGRLVVLDHDQTLVGLVCLTNDGKEFCGVPHPAGLPDDSRSA